MKLECYVRDGAELDIQPAPSTRAWMDATPNRHAYRCLPLSIANAHGWEIRCPQALSARWNGGELTTDVAFEFFGDPPADGNPPALCAFGSGIVTFHVPALFRTEPGYDLWITGPVNHVKDGIQPLTAVVETDWLTEYGFTMNWKLTRADHPVRFERGEPYCFLFPIPHALCEAIRPTLHRFDDDPALRAEYYGAEQQRREFQESIGVRSEGTARFAPEDSGQKWQRRYFRGVDARDEPVPEHRTKLVLSPFEVRRTTNP